MSKSENISRSNLWISLRRRKASTWALRMIMFLFLIALFANFIANDRPFYCKVKGKTYYPIFNQIATNLGISKMKVPQPGKEWHDLNYESSLWPIIPFASHTLDPTNAYSRPFSGAKKNDRFRHILGTGILGKDVAASLIHGTRLAMVIGIISILLATIIGLFIGGVAGFFGDHSIKLTWISIFGLGLGMLAATYYTKIFIELWSIEGASIFASTLTTLASLFCALFIGSIIFFLFSSIGKIVKANVDIPLDLILMRLIEIVQSIPGLLILLVLAGMFSSRSLWIVIFIIAFVKWAGIAKFVRAELLQIRSLPYINSARASGIKEMQILFRHALPNALTPIYIAMAFGIASAVLLEATVSFLGIGIEQEIVSWGKMLAQARQKPSAWWLAIFPGLMIFLCVISFNVLGDALSKINKR